MAADLSGVTETARQYYNSHDADAFYATIARLIGGASGPELSMHVVQP